MRAPGPLQPLGADPHVPVLQRQVGGQWLAPAHLPHLLDEVVDAGTDGFGAHHLGGHLHPRAAGFLDGYAEVLGVVEELECVAGFGRGVGVVGVEHGAFAAEEETGGRVGDALGLGFGVAPAALAEGVARA